MRILNALAICTSFLFLAGPAAACDYPEKPSVPNGSSATKDEMIAGQKEVKQYVADLESYQQCLVEEEKVARAAIQDLTPEVEEQREEVLNKKYNAAHDEMMKVAAEFNAELKEYQSRDEE
jgi:hypothetical protein